MNEETRVTLLTRNGRASLHYTNENGELIWLSFRKEAEAQIAAEIICSRIDLPCPDTEITFSKFAAVYVEKHLMTVCAEATFGNTRSWIRSRLMPYFRDMRLADMTADTMRDFQEHLSASSSSNRTINRIMDVLSSMLTKAVHWRYLDTNPALCMDKLPR